ncbi:MAG: hypothetical protein IPM63_13655 [Acidobacteriota bacterium]|nr:MAG: hypothetical protein IPM63_13655 [Acidobacteriota bacterium]
METAILDVPTGEISIRRESGMPRFRQGLPIDGLFSRVEDDIYSLYRTVDGLYFQHGKERIPIDEQTKTRFAVKESIHEFSIERDGEVRITVTYPKPSLVVDPSLDPTPFVSYEDFDFLHLVHRLANDPDRRERILSL